MPASISQINRQSIATQRIRINTDNLYDIPTRFRTTTSGSGTSLLIGKVLGGNALPIGEDLYPTDKSTAIPLELLSDEGLILTIPSLSSWEETDLDNDFVEGDELPILPDGLAYVQLQRPYSLDSKSWDANLEGSYASTGDQFQATRAIVDAFNLALINVYFSREDFTLMENVSPTSFAITVTDANGVNISTNHVPNSVTKADNKITIDLTNALQSTYTVTLNFGSVAQIVEQDSPTLFNDPFDGSVSFGGYANTIIICTNATSNQMFQKGELVLISQETVSITDEQSVTRSVTQILGPISAAQVHDHKTYNKDGLGRAGFDVTFGGVGT